MCCSDLVLDIRGMSEQQINGPGVDGLLIGEVPVMCLVPVLHIWQWTA